MSKSYEEVKQRADCASMAMDGYHAGRGGTDEGIVLIRKMVTDLGHYADLNYSADEFLTAVSEALDAWMKERS